MITLRLAGLLAAVIILPTLATAATPFRISVAGQPISQGDIDNLTVALLKLHVLNIEKDPGALPVIAPYAWYAGKDAVSGRSIIWHLRSADQRSPEYSKEGLAAGILAVLESGTAKGTWQRIYVQTPNTMPDRVALGKAIVEALSDASVQTVDYSARQDRWIRVNAREGVARSILYRKMKLRGLTAYNPAFSAGCMDRLEDPRAAWPYKGEVVPSRDLACHAVASKVVQQPNPEAMVRLPGAFSPGCSWYTDVTISFDNNDRVEKVKVSKPIPNCL